MPDPCSTPTRHRTAIRAALAGVGLIQVVDGLYALLAPSSFYGDFPLGRGWVEALPSYSEHLVRDVGGLFLATGAVLLAAAWTLQRRLVIVAAASFLLFSLPHAIYHLLNLGPYSTGDAIANALGVAGDRPASGLGPVRAPPPERPPRAERRPGAAAGDGNARIPGVPENTRNPLVRFGYRESRRRYGKVMDPLRIYAHNPRVMLGYAALETASERSTMVDERLKHLAQTRAAMVCGCEWCLDFALLDQRGGRGRRGRSARAAHVLRRATASASSRSWSSTTRPGCRAARSTSPTSSSTGCARTSTRNSWSS